MFGQALLGMAGSCLVDDERRAALERTRLKPEVSMMKGLSGQCVLIHPRRRSHKPNLQPMDRVLRANPPINEFSPQHPGARIFCLFLQY